MALTGVLRPGHVALRVLDLDPALKHYSDVLGLIVTGRDAQGRAYLKAWDEHDHHSVVLRQSDRAGIDYMGWRVDSPATLTRLSQEVHSSGLASDCHWIEAGEHLRTGPRFRFTIPTGHVMELYAEKDKVGNGMALVDPEPLSDDLKGMAPSRFDHALLYGDDLDGSVKLFTEILGFSLTEQLVAGPDQTRVAAFLTCSNKPHDVAFIRYPEKNRLHHVSFYLSDWNELLRASDLIARHRVSHDIGPTRHGVTRGMTLYFFDPSGNRNEVFAGGYIAYPDRPALVWTQEEMSRALFYHDRKVNEPFIETVT